ncbi:MAG: glycoside hydrolase [Flavobacteriales bacterium]|nr:glycoside hydrolase [Flavobacteriales bacterium]
MQIRGVLLVSLVLALLLGIPGTAQEKINGVSYVGQRDPITPAHLQPVKDIHANWVTFMPFAFGEMNGSRLRHDNLRWQWWGETPEGINTCIKYANEHGLDVMIKPQIWFNHGAYTGHFELDSEDQWREFESDYFDYIMKFALLSEEHHLPLLCIGTELTQFAVQRESFWRMLIAEIRKVYKGKLTYAANWDSYERIGFWDVLDYVGVDAYFPVCEQRTPSLKAIMKGWQPHLRKLKSLSDREQRPILFTEWGYRSCDYCAHEPWDYTDDHQVNTSAQFNAYHAVFKLFWDQSWFAGGFLWKWFPEDELVGGPENNDFTPQNKPVEELIASWFLQTSAP